MLGTLKGLGEESQARASRDGSQPRPEVFFARDLAGVELTFGFFDRRVQRRAFLVVEVVASVGWHQVESPD